jgi:hypothetical protein
MRRLVQWTPWTIAILVLLGMPAPGAAQPGVPLDLLLDVCVLPADDCANVHEVMKVTIDDQPREMAILRTEVLRGSPRTGSIQTELTLKPMRVVGPAEILKKLEPGARVRMRAQTRLASRMMMVQSVEPSKRK